MGGELVESLPDAKPPASYTEQFESVCSWYMSIGMTYDEFWEGDCVLPKYYREAHEYRNTNKNQELWLLGAYVHEAVAVVVGNALKKKGAKELKYSEKPYPVTKLEQKYEQEQKELQEKRNRERAKAVFSAWAERFKEKKGGK